MPEAKFVAKASLNKIDPSGFSVLNMLSGNIRMMLLGNISYPVQIRMLPGNISNVTR